MSDFKVGDRVRIRDELGNGSWFNLDATYTIKEIEEVNMGRMVSFRETPYITLSRTLEHAHTYIVALTGSDRRPRPSARPFVHHSLASAENEARRLAKKNPAQEFAVYKRLGAHVADVTVTMREVA